MSEQSIFKRYELKYLLTRAQFMELKKLLAEYTIADAHGESTICSLYFDTPDSLLIRRSLEGPLYKEKLRLRSYGVATPSSKVYVELKKKYDGVVYKRREEMTEAEACRFLLHRENGKDTQIAREIDYCFKRYPGLGPACLLTYSRQAFYGKTDSEFRLTFDTNILWRDYDLNLRNGIYGEPVLQEDLVLMEVKVADHMPMWLVQFLSKNRIYKTSFSKYGAAYKAILTNNHSKEKGLKQYA